MNLAERRISTRLRIAFVVVCAGLFATCLGEFIHFATRGDRAIGWAITAGILLVLILGGVGRAEGSDD